MKKMIIIGALMLPVFCSAQDSIESRARVTYYNLSGRTATGTKVRKGICAVSRDLERMGFRMGKKVYVDGYGVFDIQDRTSSRLTKTVDIWIPKGERIKNGKDVRIRLYGK